MAQLVYLDKRGDINAVHAKLEMVGEQEAALVVPPGCRVLSGPLALRRLMRHASDLVLDLALITNDPILRRLAEDEGLPVYPDARSYQRSAAVQQRPSPWEPRRRTAEKPGRSAAPLVLAVLVFMFVATVIYLLIPETTVILVPAGEPVTGSVDLSADPNLQAVDFKQARVPSRLTYVLVEGTETGQATGKKPVAVVPAEGRVTFVDRANEPVVIAAGTVVSTTNNVLFRTTAEVRLAGNNSTGKAGVIAVEPGEGGNVGRLQIVRVEGDLNLKVAVFNEDPTTGGGAKEISVVTPDDWVRVRRSLLARIQDDAWNKVAAEVKAGELLPPQSVQLTVLEEKYDRDVGEQAQVVTLRLGVRERATIYKPEDVSALIERTWQPALKTGYYVPPGTVKLDQPEVRKAEDTGVVQLTVRVRGTAVSRINVDRVTGGVRWKTADEATEYLSSSFILAEDPVVYMDPDWAMRSLRVKVVVEQGP